MNDKVSMHWAAALGLLLAAFIAGWFSRSSAHVADSVRMEQLIRDSTAYAGWVERRDEQRDSMSLAFKLKDDTLSWTREELEYAIHHRKPSRIVDNDSLHRAIEAELGMLR